MEAGLPSIGATPVKLVEELEQRGVLLKWTIEEYDFEKLRQLKAEMKEKVLVAREEFRVKNQIERLIHFYDSLIESK